MHSLSTRELPWHCEIYEWYDYKEVVDWSAMNKYATVKELRARMDRHWRRVEKRIPKYGLTPLPPLHFPPPAPTSLYRRLEKWCAYEFDLRHPLNDDDMGTPRENFNKKKKKQSDRVIRNMHIYCSCAARIITMALRTRARSRSHKKALATECGL